MLKILPFFAFFVISASNRNIPGVPDDIMDSFIKKHADLSVDPCDDFYSHVCNSKSRGEFDVALYEHKMSIVEKNWKKYPYGKVTNLELSEYDVSMKSLFNEKLCNRKNIDFFIDIIDDGYLSCQTIRKRIKEFVKNIKNKSIFLAKIARALILFKEIEFLDDKIRELFSKIIEEMRVLIENTGWIKNRKVTQKYLEALDRMKLYTFRDFEPIASDLMETYLESYDYCMRSYRFPINLHEQLCQFYGISLAYAPFRQQSVVLDTFTNSEIEEILSDDFAVFNSADRNILVGNDILLLVNSKYVSSLYGSVGYVLSHELMHTFIFDEHDKNAKLYNYWTNDTSCIQQQATKTCQTYRTAACGDDHDQTFEEDGADFMGYRLIHNLFQKQNFQRKKHVQSIDGLNKDQLFFYGAATVFCDYDTYSAKYHHQNQHSNHYQRINSMVSQIDSFPYVFSCKPSDRIVRNKAAHCEIYGSSDQYQLENQDQNQNYDDYEYYDYFHVID